MTTLSNEQLREENGQYSYSGNWHRICRCGHTLANHTAAAPHICNDDGECGCTNFRLEGKRKYTEQDLASQRQAILKEVRGEVIGEDEIDYRNLNGNLNIVKKKNYRNQLRTEQRIKLAAMEKRV